MIVIPAIDIIKGKCVRLVKGNYALKKVYSANPLKIAKFFEEAGLKRLHLIDLEGAKAGMIKNWDTIKRIARNTNLLIELGGGVQEGDIKKLLSLGVWRVILGSIVVKDPKKFKTIFGKFGGEKIVAAVDVKKGKVYYRGWQKRSRKGVNSFLKDLVKTGVKTIILTDIERDGTLRGPNFLLYKKLVSKFPKTEIFASGGVRNIKDLIKLSKIGVFGVVVGKAIYENKISLAGLKSAGQGRAL